MITNQELFEEKWLRYRNLVRKSGKNFRNQVLQKPEKVWIKTRNEKICLTCKHKPESSGWTYCHYCKGELELQEKQNGSGH